MLEKQIPGEVWHVIDEFPNYYVSNFGRIKHEHRLDVRRVQINDRGFPTVLLARESSSTRYLRQLNKLVARAFLQEPDDPLKNAIWHIDGDLTNCRADNLLWDTRVRVLEWNEMHRTRMPRYKTPQVKNNRTGVIYSNAFECGMAEGEVESRIVWQIEGHTLGLESDKSPYRYVFKGSK